MPPLYSVHPHHSGFVCHRNAKHTSCTKKITHLPSAADLLSPQKREEDPLFYPPTTDGTDWYKIPVNERLDKFREKAVPLVSEVCRRAVEDAGINMEDIGKLVVVSSTGFLGPGLDCHIIEEIGLR